jgi:AcrR family transcriptional regulator
MENNFSSRQMEIMISTVNLIEKGGIGNVTIKHLAKEINVTEGAIYKHFNSKEEILTKTLEMARADVMDVFLKARNSVKPTLDILEDIYVKQSAFFKSNPAYVIIILSEALYKELGFLKDIIRAIMNDSRIIIQELIEEGQKRNQIRKDIGSGQLTFIFMSALRNCINQWYLSDFETDIQSNCKQAWQTVSQLIKA